MNALLERFPKLAATLPYTPLAGLPTPVHRLDALSAELAAALDGGGVLIKRDDLSARPYGGNKVRKLEFLLGQALAQGKRRVLTFGAAGSNHALATAIYARQLGLGSISMLMPQPNAHAVRRNVLMSYKAGAELHYGGSMNALVTGALGQMARHGVRDGVLPLVILPGGTSPLGMAGFVAAGFELAQQVEDGLLPEPDRLYAASGTMGTVVGLLLGLQAAGLTTRVVAVRVTPPGFTSRDKARRFFAQTNALLHRADPSFPMLAFPEAAFEFREEFYGQGYAQFTPEGMAAVRRVQEAEGVALEGTYTGKTFAALLDDARRGVLRGKQALFWHTYNGHGFHGAVADMDYRVLPPAFHRYFEQPVQALDRDGE